MVASQLFDPDDWMRMDPVQITKIVTRLQAEVLKSESLRAEMQKVARPLIKK
jgi:hypothetical protein